MIPPPVWPAGGGPNLQEPTDRWTAVGSPKTGGGMSTSRPAVVLLGAGYGTRLYPLTKDRPKALLRFGTGVILDAILKLVIPITGTTQRMLLVTNHKFLPQFQVWRRRQRAPVELVDDGTTTPQTRLGAIRDLRLALKRLAPTDDVLVLGTDNLFTWPLADFLRVAATKRPAATVAVHRIASLREASRYGVVTLNRQARITRCVEKPSAPFSRTVVLCVYYFPASLRGRLDEFVQGRDNVDAPGYFIEWLVKREPVYGYMTTGDWFDIGSYETYQQAISRWFGRRPVATKTGVVALSKR